MVESMKLGERQFPFKSALNASTLMPFGLRLDQQLRVAAEAGYDGYEIWVRDVEAYVDEGHSLSTLRNEVEALGIAIPNAIAFFRWADRDERVREEALLQAKREMELLAELGCLAVAAPPFGDVEGVTPHEFAQRFAELAKLGAEAGVEPYLEFWGRAARLNTLEQTLEVLRSLEASEAKLLLDPFHLYTGGSKLDSLHEVAGRNIGIVHANDYGATPPRETIADADRLFPGDGVAPLGQLAQLLHQNGYAGYLSLELFMESYGDLGAVEVAKLGLEKLQAAFSLTSL
ncbi:sugar phosphate isomerase/epimerase family protein [Paenibacillus soyae]|uniref:Sugar phosphate isomerase/epimerase n=1 Tax=Paenibacillus soyae TaxID=2969249 RepID=A0A9X2S9X2_9BACL|nr:sugar phosphate isomerase/epimerase family protein [Paenibacillus soyae]MCR2805611.1 sugar phosphate isomerase/epimerase [Paenibacillus soyae]